MRKHSKKFQAEWMASDHKPKGKLRRRIEGSNRWEGRREIKKELNNEEERTVKKD